MFAERLRQKLSGVINLDADQIGALQAHCELLLRWNKVLNLTSIGSLEKIVERHYGESLFLGTHMPFNVLQIADIGSGAGFPGIPIAVLRPDCSVTLIEANSRKAVFLREATRHLANVRVLPRRAEAVEEAFDYAISRAVSYAELRPVLRKIAKRAALLTGAEAPPQQLGFDWEDPIALPWGDQRFLRMGVSRETHSC